MKYAWIVAIGSALLLSACGQPGLVSPGASKASPNVKAAGLPLPGGTDLNGETDRDRAIDVFQAYLNKTYPKSRTGFVYCLTKPAPGATYVLQADVRTPDNKGVMCVVRATLTGSNPGSVWGSKYTITSVEELPR
ncbi:hypothetical protein J7643_18240 [bacterium]|nr:hypothetical protein [bacterium]